MSTNISLKIQYRVIKKLTVVDIKIFRKINSPTFGEQN